MFCRWFCIRIWQCDKYLTDSPRHIKDSRNTVGKRKYKAYTRTKRIGNSVVECLSEEQKVGGSNPSHSTQKVRTIQSGSAKFYRSGCRWRNSGNFLTRNPVNMEI